MSCAPTISKVEPAVLPISSLKREECPGFSLARCQTACSSPKHSSPHFSRCRHAERVQLTATAAMDACVSHLSSHLSSACQLTVAEVRRPRVQSACSTHQRAESPGITMVYRHSSAADERVAVSVPLKEVRLDAWSPSIRLRESGTFANGDR